MFKPCNPVGPLQSQSALQGFLKLHLQVDKVVATSSTLLATVKKSAFDLAEAIVLKPAFGVTREDAAAKVQGKWEFVKARGLLGVSGSILTECKKTAGKGMHLKN